MNNLQSQSIVGSSDSRRICLSVVVPIFGVEQYLRQCVDSVLAACEGIPSQVILVDDGGIDGCPAICDEYERKNDGCGGRCEVVVIHKENGGYGSAVNAGFDLAKGEWISIVEPDDWVEKGMYATLLSGVAGEKVDIVKAKFQYVLPSGVIQIPEDWEGIPIDDVFRIEEYPDILARHPSIWSAIYRRTFLRRHDIRMREVPGAGWVDNPFLVQTMCLAHGICFKPTIVYNYRSTLDSLCELRGKWEMPYARMKDELAWFGNNKVPLEVLCARYRAYVHYLWLMSECALTDATIWSNVIHAVQDVSRELDWGAIVGSSVLSRTEKMAFWLYRHMPRFAILRIKYRPLGRVASVLLKIIGLFVLK